MLTDYFRDVSFKKSTFPGFYIVQYHNRSYFACPYGERMKGKKEISAILASLKTFPKYRAAEFEFHHVVERPHLADISFEGPLVNELYGGMPAVMLHRGEHHTYNRILHSRQTRDLYMRDQQDLPEDVVESEQAVRRLLVAEKQKAKQEIRQRISIMREVYRGVYEDNNVLYVIARNIINRYDAMLDRI